MRLTAKEVEDARLVYENEALYSEATVSILDGYAQLLRDVEAGNAILIRKDSDGEWPDWAYEQAGRRLQYVGGTDQWKHASVRMAYLSVVFRALAQSQSEAPR